MRIRVWRRLLVSLFSLVIVCGLTTKSDGGVIPWIYDAIFGPVRGGLYGASYRPYCPTSAYPRVYQSAGFRPTIGYMSPGCSPCGTMGNQVAFFASGCSPCATSGCGIQPCSLASSQRAIQNGGPEPTPADPSRKTFADEKNGSENSGFRPRRTGVEGVNSTDDVSSPKEDEEFLEPETTIRKRVVAPATPPNEEGAESDSNSKEADAASNVDESGKQQKSSKSGPADQKESDAKEAESQSGASRIGPRFKYDEKITWRVIPKRTRLSLRAEFVNPTTVRRRIDVNADWVSVPADTRIVKK